jgi:DNA repair protein RadA/Sms
VGFDLNRLNLLLAVMNKRAGLSLNNQDVYVNVVGGLKVSEPAADLAIIFSIASAHKNLALPEDVVVFGEVGLSGEIRSVGNLESRLREAKKMGFGRAIGPRSKQIKEIESASDVRQSLALAFKSAK